MTADTAIVSEATHPPRRPIEMIDDVESFESLRDEWTELLVANEADGLFLTWEWLWTWWQHLRGGRQLRLLTLRRNGALLSLAPFVVRPADLRAIPPLAAVELLGSGTAGSDHLDILLRREVGSDPIQHLAEVLDQAGQPLALTRLRDAGRWRDLADALTQRGWSCDVRSAEICPVIALPESFKTFLAACGPAHRANFQRRLRRLRRDFALRFERVHDEAQRPRALATLLDLHQQRWQGRGASEFVAPSARAFHEAFSRIALQHGWLRLFVLSLDGRPVAAWYGFRYGRVSSFFQSGFEPTLASLGVGLVAMGLAIEAAIAEGATQFDFLHGDEPYKSLWTSASRQLWRLDATPPGLKRVLYRGATSLRRGAGDVVRLFKTDVAKSH